MLSPVRTDGKGFNCRPRAPSDPPTHSFLQPGRHYKLAPSLLASRQGDERSKALQIARCGADLDLVFTTLAPIHTRCRPLFNLRPDWTSFDLLKKVLHSDNVIIVSFFKYKCCFVEINLQCDISIASSSSLSLLGSSVIVMLRARCNSNMMSCWLLAPPQ